MIENIGNKFRIVQKIGTGSFSQIYKAINIKTNQQLAVKLQPINATIPQLTYESKLYLYLHKHSSLVDKGIPNVYYASTEGQYKVLVMDLLGPSLETLFSQCHSQFSLKTVLMLMDQMIQRIEYLHSRDFVHRDIKPANFCIGTDKNLHQVYLIDFGLALRFRYRDTQCYKVDKQIINGTARYASLNTHLGIDQSRRDNMESLGYVCIEFLKGKLPWQGLKATNKKEKYAKIKEVKMETSIDKLCEGLPIQFNNYLNYCRNMRYDQTPNYQAIRNSFNELFSKLGYKNDLKYDWINPQENVKKESELGNAKMVDQKLSIKWKENKKSKVKVQSKIQTAKQPFR